MGAVEAAELTASIRDWARQLGFADCRLAGVELGEHREHLGRWLDEGLHGEMVYMARHAELRTEPQRLWPGTATILSLRMDYWPPEAAPARESLADPLRAYVSRYALGRDYHKLMRQRLKALLARIRLAVTEPFPARVFCDSAPVLEKALGQRAGLGFIGKNTLLIHPKAGSYFFLGEVFLGLELPVDPPWGEDDAGAFGAHCGRCHACLDACPTGAFIAPFRLDARRCISYLTIEHPGVIPEPLRAGIGNRIFGCDDCQLVCPWNRFARATAEPDLLPRHELDAASLLELWALDEPGYLRLSEGSPLRRLGWERWRRNLAVALGNAGRAASTRREAIDAALRLALETATPLVAEHIHWALAQGKR